MALDYKYINTVPGNPRYTQVYAIVPHPGGGYEHIYPDGTKEVVSSGSGTLAADWHPPQQTVVAGAAATAAIASGAVSTPTTIIEQPKTESTPAATSSTSTSSTVNETTSANAAGIPYDSLPGVDPRKPVTPFVSDGGQTPTYEDSKGLYQVQYGSAQGELRVYSDNSSHYISARDGGLNNLTQTQWDQEHNTVNVSSAATIAGSSAPLVGGQVAQPSSGGSNESSGTNPQQFPGKMEVTSGMTFWDLAQRHGWSVATLEELNPGIDPKHLAVGTFINIPTDGTPPSGSTGGNPPAATNAGVGPATSVTPTTDSTDKTKALESDVKGALSGWAGPGTEGKDPLKTIFEAVEKPHTDTNPLNIKNDHNQPS